MMTGPDLRLTGARVLRPEGWDDCAVTLRRGLIEEGPAREIDLSGYLVLPGLVDLHGDGFERHLAPRRGALREAEPGMVAAAAELAVNGITTGILAQFFSWEGGLRSPDFAQRVIDALARVAPGVATDLRLQLRLETHMIDDYARAEAMIAAAGIGYVVFNDHVPHVRLAQGRVPRRLTGTALKSGRSPEALLALMQALHARSGEVPEAVSALAARLGSRGILLGSHDDADAVARDDWRGRGVRVSEFPETREAAMAAHRAGDAVVLGAPNVVRGASHAGNVSALDLVAEGLCDALASDYHYPAMQAAVWRLHDLGVLDVAQGWALISSGPARVLGLADRGRLEQGCRADLVVLEAQTRRVAAVFAGGAVSYVTGDVAARFF